MNSSVSETSNSTEEGEKMDGLVASMYRDTRLSQVKHSGFDKELVEYLTKRFSLRPRTVVDLGCGRGGYTRQWKKQHPTALVVGVDGEDPTEDCFDESNTRKVFIPVTHVFGGKSTPLLIDKVEEALSVYSWEFRFPQVVFSKNLLEHLGGEEKDEFCQTLKYYSQNGATCFVFVPDYKTCMDVFYDDYTHVRPLTKISLNQLLTAAGLKNTVEEIYQVPFSWKRPLLWKFVKHLWWLVPNKELRYRFRRKALMAVIPPDGTTI